MIKHIVMWNLRGDTPAEKAASSTLLKRSFESLRGRIPGMLHLEVGIDSSGVDYACDVVLYSEFDSQAALDAYAAHPEHQRVKRELADLRVARHQVDYDDSSEGPAHTPHPQKETSP
ncbi:Dabb family protein [Polaromonas sp.]|uniref:Dabb family protein n=1 Tax=Polaromonas sp. TaxID=1869339 RepID=UPI0032634B5A